MTDTLTARPRARTTSQNTWRFRYEYRYRGVHEWFTLNDRDGDPILFRENEKAAVDRVFWALCHKQVDGVRFVQHDKVKG